MTGAWTSGARATTSPAPRGSDAPGGPGETRLVDLALFGLGNRFSLERLWPEYSDVDLVAQAGRLQVAVTLMLGRHDRHVPSELAARWLTLLQAPAKRLVWFEASAHNPPFEEPARFAAEVVRAAGPAAAE